MDVRIDQLEQDLAQKLAAPLKNALPGHYQLRVSLLDENGRKKRRDASASNWSPASGWIEIRFEPDAEPTKFAAGDQSREKADKSMLRSMRVPASPSSNTSALAEIEIKLIRALDRAESTPGWKFVSLKKFRDEVLPYEPSAAGEFNPSDVHWQEAIRSAIERRLILVGKVPNPKSPQFPVTSIRLNRLIPAVQEVLGQPKNELEFRPIHIKGEPLSATILRERR
jgi:hypothetical protein